MLPILLFQLLYIWLYFFEIVRVRAVFALALVLGYCAVAFYARSFPHILNGSLIYAPAAVFLLFTGIYHAVERLRERYVMLSALGLFAVALTARTMDNAVCSSFPLGTHFMWHICNTLVLYLMIRGLLANRFEQTRQQE